MGSFNVTVLDGTWNKRGKPLEGASVFLAQPALSADTDTRGQVTFSGPDLTRALTVSIGKKDFRAFTAVRLNATNLTVYLYPNQQPPYDPPDNPNPGDPPKPAQVSGRVFGFKKIPGMPEGPGISPQARVNFISRSVLSAPPFGGIPLGTVIAKDGDSFRYPLMVGTYNLYAVYGAFDSLNQVFHPFLLGLRKNIQVRSEAPVTDQDIVLTTALDQKARIDLIQAPVPMDSRAVEYGAYVSLDMGNRKVIYLNQAKGTGKQLVVSGLPEVDSSDLFFVGLASLEGNYPYSYTFRRQSGDLNAGVKLGPFLGFTQLVDPLDEGELKQGKIRWKFLGPTPNLTQLQLKTTDVPSKTLWRIVLPGDQNEVELPKELVDNLPHGKRLFVILYTANSPRFDFDRFNFSQLSSGRWTSYTVNYSSLTVP
jgi:hypothetical protein